MAATTAQMIVTPADTYDNTRNIACPDICGATRSMEYPCYRLMYHNHGTDSSEGSRITEMECSLWEY